MLLLLFFPYLHLCTRLLAKDTIHMALLGLYWGLTVGGRFRFLLMLDE